MIWIQIEVQEPHYVVFFQHSFACLESIFESSFWTIRNSSPVFRTGYAKSHFCFKTGLVEAWEHSETVVGLELSVEILLTIRVIDIGVETSPILLIG
jgi:hypothetical protein